jgi:uncharacterized membrane protein
MNLTVLRRAFVAASSVWAAALPVSAWAIAGAHQPVLLSLPVVVYAVGATVCHQLPARSFHLWGTQLPVCARCTGIYVAAAAVALAGPALPRTSRPAMRAAILLSVLPTAATLAFEWTTGQTPSNTVRALAGAPIGGVVAWLIAGL